MHLTITGAQIPHIFQLLLLIQSVSPLTPEITFKLLTFLSSLNLFISLNPLKKPVRAMKLKFSHLFNLVNLVIYLR